MHFLPRWLESRVFLAVLGHDAGQLVSQLLLWTEERHSIQCEATAATGSARRKSPKGRGAETRGAVCDRWPHLGEVLPEKRDKVSIGIHEVLDGQGRSVRLHDAVGL